MSFTEIRGPAGVRHAITEFLRAELPATAAACVRAWDLSRDDGAEALPVPVSAPDDPKRDAYIPRELQAIDRWPLLSVTSGRARQTEFTRDYDVPDPVLVTTYPVRVFTWVKSSGYDDAQDLRDNLATAVRITCLAHLQLGTEHLVLVPSTVITDFSSVEHVKGDRFVAGSFVGFDVQATETLTDRLTIPGGPARDTVATVIADATVIPAQQELP